MIYEGTVNLPAEGLWRARNLGQSDAIRELYLVPSNTWHARQLGKRMYAAVEKEAIASGNWRIREGYYDCKEFAIEGTGLGPSSMLELAEFQQSKKRNVSWSSINHNNRELPDLFGKEFEGPCVHLIPNVQFSLAKQPLSPREEERGRNGYRTPVRWLVPREKRRPTFRINESN